MRKITSEKCTVDVKILIARSDNYNSQNNKMKDIFMNNR